MSGPWREVTGGLSVVCRLALAFKVKERRRLFLRSILWEGEEKIPQPGCAMMSLLGGGAFFCGWLGAAEIGAFL